MTALATQLTGPPIIPQSSSRIASLERVSLRPESLLDPQSRCNELRSMLSGPVRSGPDPLRSMARYSVLGAGLG
jgi:hypothetical protein